MMKHLSEYVLFEGKPPRIKDDSKEIDELLAGFENVGKDEAGNRVGNCKMCKAHGVLVDEHLCEEK